MPIRAEMRHRYPKEWPAISHLIRWLANWECEWCGAGNGQPHPETGSKVVLTVAHILNDEPEDCRPANLAALCQRCHNRHDMPSRRAGIRKRAREALLVADIFDPETSRTP